jgi:hypothetical protein
MAEDLTTPPTFPADFLASFGKPVTLGELAAEFYGCSCVKDRSENPAKRSEADCSVEPDGTCAGTPNN